MKKLKKLVDNRYGGLDGSRKFRKDILTIIDAYLTDQGVNTDLLDFDNDEDEEPLDLSQVIDVNNVDAIKQAYKRECTYFGVSCPPDCKQNKCTLINHEAT